MYECLIVQKKWYKYMLAQFHECCAKNGFLYQTMQIPLKS
ncbi:MAG: hypothetical protein ACOX55_04515 [Christensenellales bacterium]